MIRYCSATAATQRTRLIFKRTLSYSLVFVLAYTPLLAELNETMARAQTTTAPTATFKYDAIGNVLEVADPRLQLTTHRYDSHNRRVETQQPSPLPNTARPRISTVYDGLAQIEKVTDPRNLSTTYAVSGLGNNTTLSSPDTGNTARTFDDVGNVLTSTDARGKATSFAYDGIGRVTLESYSSGVASAFEYDGGPTPYPGAAGRLTKFSDESGNTTLVYDPFGRLLAKTQSHAGLTLETKYTYWMEGNGIGKISSLTYPSGNRLNFNYGSDGDLSSLWVNPGLPDGTTNFGTSIPLLIDIAYTPQGSVAAWTWGNDTELQPNRYIRTYDLNGRVKSYPLGVSTATGSANITSKFTFAYSQSNTAGSDSAVSTLTVVVSNANAAVNVPIRVFFDGLPADKLPYGATRSEDGIPFVQLNGVPAHGTVNANVQVTNSGGTPLQYQARVQSMSAEEPGLVRTLGYDPAGRITSYTHTGNVGAANADQFFEYDNLDRLIKFSALNTSQAYTYDLTGNRTSHGVAASTYSLSVSPLSNRVSSTTGPYPAKSNQYLANGAIASDGSAVYTYSDRGRISRVVKSGVSTDYLYNGLGQRVMKAGSGVDSGKNFYVYDENGHLLGEYLANGKPVQETVFLGAMPVAVISNGISYIYADHIDTPRIITSSADNRISWRWESADPFGMLQPVGNGGKIASFNPRFPGQLFDKETNNHYNYYRDYDPQTGRYVQSDPIGLKGGINTYGYVGANPLTRIDPLGLAWTCQGILPFISCRWIPPIDPFAADGFLPPTPAPLNPWTQTNTETRTPAFCPPDGPDCSAIRRENIARCDRLYGNRFALPQKLVCYFLANHAYKRCKERSPSSDGDPNGDGMTMVN